MIELTDDNWIIRSTAYWCYAITATFLLVCGFYNVLLIYCLLGITLISAEPGYIDDVQELDHWQKYEVLWTARPVDEVDGYVLLPWKMDDVINSSFDIIIFLLLISLWILIKSNF